MQNEKPGRIESNYKSNKGLTLLNQNLFFNKMNFSIF